MNWRHLMLIILISTLASCSLIPENNPTPASFTSIPTSPVILTYTPTPVVALSTPSPAVEPTLESTATPTSEPKFTPSPTPSYVYDIQMGSPAVVANFLHPDVGCNYTGIGGQVFGKDGKPISDLIVVKVTGTLEGKDVEYLAVTGGHPALGPGGYEIALADHLTGSTNTLFLQLFDLNGIPQSQNISFNTYSDCTKNLIILNFVKASNVIRNYIPVVINK
jgi:hypothetical protein